MESPRKTTIVRDRHASLELRLHAARERSHGLQVMKFEQAMVRMAGGFFQPIDSETLRDSVKRVLPETDVGDLEEIKELPGMVSAASVTLHKVWRSGIDLKDYAEKRAADSAAADRLTAISNLEKAVLEDLPAYMLRPVDIVGFARKKIGHAKSILGSMDITGLTELSPCWRPFLSELAEEIKIRWIAGPRHVPDWLDENIEVVTMPSTEPEIQVFSAATPYHEAIETVRWVRSLIASGQAKPWEIAIASTSTSIYDEHLLALSAEAGFDIHFSHGISALASKHGQASAALADIVVRGLSQTRLRRLYSICRDTPIFKDLPDGWTRVLGDAHLSNPESWDRFFNNLPKDAWPDDRDHTPVLRKIVDLLSKGDEFAEEIGKSVLSPRAFSIWKKALRAGPVEAIDTNINSFKQGDRIEPCASVVWMPAHSLAACPRRFVRLIGLNSSRWPRGMSEDRLLPKHVIPIFELNPIPMNFADRRDFESILATTGDLVALSYARRGPDGRQLGTSPLLTGLGKPTYVSRSSIPVHALSESDRLLARLDEFAELPEAKNSAKCWGDWQVKSITGHDGLVRQNHPFVEHALSRIQSASSLKLLLRNPIGYVWRYGFGWKALEDQSDPLMLNALDLGSLVHEVLETSLREIEPNPGLHKASGEMITKAVEKTIDSVTEKWKSERGIPPLVIWLRTLEDVRDMAVSALNYRRGDFSSASCYSEVPFGRDIGDDRDRSELPWDPSITVTIPKTDISIAGWIDRLDLTKDGKRALVCDYKTGKAPKGDIVLNGGSELQRCLYAYAVRSLLGEKIEIQASLYYPRDEVDKPLEDPDLVLGILSTFLIGAKKSLIRGATLPGIDTGGDYDEFVFALPATAQNIYHNRKFRAIEVELSQFIGIWEEL